MLAPFGLTVPFKVAEVDVMLVADPVVVVGAVAVETGVALAVAPVEVFCALSIAQTR